MKKRNKYHYGNLLRYLTGQFSREEKHQLEKEMQKDPFLEDAIDGLSMLSQKEIEDDISFLNKKIKRQSGQSNLFLLYRIAAAISILVVVSSLFVVFYYSKPYLYEKEIAAAEIPVEKAEDDKITVTKEETFTESIRVFEPQVESIAARPIPETIIAEEDIGIAKESEVTVAQEQMERKHEYFEPVTIQLRATATEPASSPARVASDLLNQVSGIVISSEDGMPITGASIVVKGSSSGTITDADGKFSLTLPEGYDKTLVVAFIGMDTKELQAQTDEELKVVLEPNLLALDEVIVAGYGVARKRVLSTSIGEIAYEDLYSHPDFSSASPVIGNRGFTKYVNENVQFPESVDQKRAVVVLSFVVNSAGRPENITVLRSPGYEFSSEAIRLLQEGPDWQPAKLGDEILQITTQIRMVLRK